MFILSFQRCYHNIGVNGSSLEHTMGCTNSQVRITLLNNMINPEASSRLTSDSQRSLMSGSHQVTATIPDHFGWSVCIVAVTWCEIGISKRWLALANLEVASEFIININVHVALQVYK